MLSNQPTSTDAQTSRSWLRRFSIRASLVIAGAGAVILVGWLFGIGLLTRGIPGQVSVNPLTAVCFMLSGGALWLTLRPARAGRDFQWLAKGCAAAVFAIGVVKLTGYLGGWETGIDQILFPDKLNVDHPQYKSRMAPNTAFCFFSLGAALFLMHATHRPRGWPSTEILAVPVLFIAMLALIGYFYRIQHLFGLGNFTPMALPTALLFLILSLGILAARPSEGFMAVVTSDGAGGTMVRQLFPALIASLVILGWLRLEGERRGLYSSDLGVTLHTSSTIGIFALLVWWSAHKFQQSELKRRRSEAQVDRYFRMSLDMLCIAGTDGYFKRLNPAFFKTLGHTDEELLSRPFLDFVHPEDRDATVSVVAALGQGEPVSEFENRYICKDGSYRWLSWRSQPVPDENLIFATARDVTVAKASQESIQRLNEELRLQTEQLRAANEELESFSYSVSHDLRAPLRHVQGYVDMLVRAAGDQLQPKAIHYLNTIRDCGAEMGRLIDDLLAFSRVGRTEFRVRPMPMDKIVQEVIHDLEMETRDRNIEWVLPTLPEAMGDPALIRQVLANLIGNAVKYTSQRQAARIEVTAEREDGDVLFQVRDNGVGFDMAYVHKLFGIFQRLHRAEEFEGTGIGLATVRRIVARHGGRTWAEGIPGQGATFYFTLPAAPSQDKTS